MSSPNVHLFRTKLYKQQGDARWELGLRRERLWSSSDLFCVVNFLPLLEWRNCIDSLLSEARVICITCSPFSLPVASAFPSLCVYSVRSGPCADRSTAVLCRFPSPWLGFNCLSFMLGQVVCDTHSKVGLTVAMTFKLLSVFFTPSFSLSLCTHTHTH